MDHTPLWINSLMEIHQLTDTVSDPQSAQRWISGVTTDSLQDHKDTHPPLANHKHPGMTTSWNRWLSGRMPDSQSRELGFKSFCDRLKVCQFSFAPLCPSSSRCINEYLAIDGGGNVSDLVLARNYCLARMLPAEVELVSE